MADNAMFVTTIEPKTNPLGLKQLREYWHYRDLLYFLARRDVLVRYKQTIFGAGAIFYPVVTMAIFTLVFGRLGRMPSDGMPYAIFVFSGLLPWALFSSLLTNVANSLPANSHLISKIYFPRLILPAASMATPVVDFLVAFPVLVILMIYFNVLPGAQILALPLFLLLGMGLTIGLGLVLAALNVAYRDLRYMTGFLIQALMFLSPVMYASSIIPPEYQAYYQLNPMVPVLDGIRWSLLGTKPADPSAVAIAAILAVTLLVAGARFFHSSSDTFADVI